MLLIFCPYSVYPVSQYGSPFFQLLLVILVDIIPSADTVEIRSNSNSRDVTV
jgi:hypothetical protein